MHKTRFKVLKSLYAKSDFIADLGLNFNTKKTQACLFRLGTGAINIPNITTNGESIEFTDVVKYLGVKFSSDMHFGEHCHEIANSTRRMIGAFRRKFGKFASSVLKTVYEQCIRPRLDYGCGAWSPSQQQSINDLERAQKLAVRSILNDWTTDYETSRTRLQYPTLQNRRAHLNLCQFYKMYNGHVDNSNRSFVHTDMSGRRTSLMNPPAPHQLELPRHWKVTYKQSFMYTGTYLWNSLSSEVLLKDKPTMYGDQEAMRFISYDKFKNYVSSLPFEFDFMYN